MTIKAFKAIFKEKSISTLFYVGRNCLYAISFLLTKPPSYRRGWVGRRSKMKFSLSHSSILLSSPSLLHYLFSSLKNKQQERSKEKFEWENNKKMNTTFICQNVKTFSITRHYLIGSPIWCLSHALFHNKCPSSFQNVAGHSIYEYLLLPQANLQMTIFTKLQIMILSCISQKICKLKLIFVLTGESSVICISKEKDHFYANDFS
jgi:hypothetical protein